MEGFQKIYGVMSYLIDMFPRTTESTKTAVDHVGRTVRQMTYFLSSRARWFKKTYHHRYLVNVYFYNLCTGIKIFTVVTFPFS